MKQRKKFTTVDAGEKIADCLTCNHRYWGRGALQCGRGKSPKKCRCFSSDRA